MTDVTSTIFLQSAPWELQAVIPEFWPADEYDNAARIAYLESRFDPFAVDNSVTTEFPCGAVLRVQDGQVITAERSVGYFQINSCNMPGYVWQRLYNARENAQEAFTLWKGAGGTWRPWYFSAKTLGLL